MIKTFYIFRHALSTHSKTGYGDKILTAEILPEGIPPINKLAEYLNNKTTDLHVSSDFPRCKQTAAIITNITGKQFVFDKRLDEFDEQYFSESFEQFKNRVKNFLEDIEAKQYASVVICTHGAVMAALKHFIIEGTFDESNLMDFPLTGNLLVIKEKESEVINFN